MAAIQYLFNGYNSYYTEVFIWTDNIAKLPSHWKTINSGRTIWMPQPNNVYVFIVYNIIMKSFCSFSGSNTGISRDMMCLSAIEGFLLNRNSNVFTNFRSCFSIFLSLSLCSPSLSALCLSPFFRFSCVEKRRASSFRGPENQKFCFRFERQYVVLRKNAENV